jgi:hypothetical protein
MVCVPLATSALAAAGLFAFLAPSTPSVDAGSRSWALCAASSTIVTGTLHVPVADLRAAQGSRGRYLSATVDVSEVLKGDRSEALVVTFFSDDRTYAPKSDELIALDGRAVVLFLTAIPEGASGRLKTYFAGDTPDAVRTLSAPVLTEIREEIARQARVLRGWRPHPEWPYEAAVKRLIEKTLVRSTAASAFRDLENLGPAAVPAIADLMDDRRRLGAAEIVLKNPPSMFEAHRIYSPVLVVDALAAILNQITGADFGSIANGGSERQRRLAVDGWRIYADMQRKHAASRAPS